LYVEPTTSFLVVRHGRIAFSYGDISQSSYLASARKSILSMLYGRAVAAGLIKLDATLEDLGIDDVGGLLPIERTAKVRDLLTARSGVYHLASSPGGSENEPARGSVTPGTHFVYNNWDFNVAGAIFEKCTGQTVHGAFAMDFAGPLQMEDFDPARQRMLSYLQSPSKYSAYHFFLSARDMARLGVVMLNEGRWGTRQIVPARWVSESTALHVPPDDISMLGHAFGYGYLWWLPADKRPGWAGSFAALGNYGQALVVLPELDMVIVHRRAVTDDFAIARNAGLTSVSPAGGEPHVMPLINMVVEAAHETR
jgi:CubicO group peptidase (beta-lactamase class C family)